jgi:hypothetical protein
MPALGVAALRRLFPTGSTSASAMASNSRWHRIGAQVPP